MHRTLPKPCFLFRPCPRPCVNRAPTVPQPCPNLVPTLSQPCVGEVLNCPGNISALFKICTSDRKRKIFHHHSNKTLLTTFTSQNIVYNQLSLLGEKLAEQTTYIESLKAKLDDKGKELKMSEGERARVEEEMLKVSQSHEELQVSNFCCTMSAGNQK